MVERAKAVVEEPLFQGIKERVVVKDKVPEVELGAPKESVDVG